MTDQKRKEGWYGVMEEVLYRDPLHLKKQKCTLEFSVCRISEVEPVDLAATSLAENENND